MEHGQLVRGLFRQLVHDVEGEVEFLLVFEADGLEDAVFVQLGLDEGGGDGLPLLADQVLLDQAVEAVLLGGELLAALHDDGVELAGLPFHGDHAVGGGGVVVDGVALVEDLDVAAHLDPPGRRGWTA